MVKTQDQINTDVNGRIQTVFPSLDIGVAGTAINSIATAFTASLSDAYNALETTRLSLMVDSATGADLDVLGQSRGIYRATGESDSIYRARVINFFSDNSGGTLSSIINQIYKYSDVAQVIHRPFAVGLGSFVLYLAPTGTSISDTTMTGAQNIVDTNEALGIRGIVRQAIVLSVQLNIQLFMSSAVPTNSYDVNTIMSQCQSAVTTYLNGLQVGNPLIISSIITACKNVSTYISDLSITNISINGQPILIRNFYPQVFAIVRPASNAPVTIST